MNNNSRSFIFLDPDKDQFFVPQRVFKEGTNYIGGVFKSTDTCSDEMHGRHFVYYFLD